ncbi:MAG: hypothetical protein H6728_11295 [Myxococcales bacterium]|nr:hypothetical protein [Myxococcales bacterium]MCB9643647.1 hypothetical protein [Myxococcales bacterium]
MHPSHFPFGRIVGVFLTSTWLLWSACSAPPTLTPKLNSACSTDTDCAGSWTCQGGQCKAKSATTSNCTNGQTRACYTASAGCTLSGTSYNCVGACKAGTQTCTNNAWEACKGEVGPSGSETCGNNIDDNCDGKVDEGCSACTNGQTRECYSGSTGCTLSGTTYNCVGVCKAGKQTCTNNAWEACKDETLPSTEVCNDNLDNDCNGKTDKDDPECGLKPCNESTTCAAPTTCMRPVGKDSGYCLLPCEVTIPGTCQGAQICARARPGYGFYCLDVYPTESDGKVPCEPDSLYKTCPRGQYCDATTKLCANPTANGTVGQTCGRNGDTCSKTHVCLTMPAAGRCVALCDSNNRCADSTKTCIKLKHPLLDATRSVCLKTCKADSECISGKEKCVTIGGDTSTTPSTTVKTCVEIGSKKRWEACELFDDNCEAGLRCYVPIASYNRRPAGICAPENCSGSADCSPLPDPSIEKACKGLNCAVCAAGILPNPDIKQCVITCSDDPTVCSKFGMYCSQPDPKQPKYCIP